MVGKDDAKVMVLPFDITDDSYHETAVKSVLDTFGRIDVLVSSSSSHHTLLSLAFCVLSFVAMYAPIMKIITINDTTPQVLNAGRTQRSVVWETPKEVVRSIVEVSSISKYSIYVRCTYVYAYIWLKLVWHDHIAIVSAKNQLLS